MRELACDEDSPRNQSNSWYKPGKKSKLFPSYNIELETKWNSSHLSINIAHDFRHIGAVSEQISIRAWLADRQANLWENDSESQRILPGGGEGKLQHILWGLLCMFYCISYLHFHRDTLRKGESAQKHEENIWKSMTHFPSLIDSIAGAEKDISLHCSTEWARLQPKRTQHHRSSASRYMSEHSQLFKSICLKIIRVSSFFLGLRVIEISIIDRPISRTWPLSSTEEFFM